MPSKRAEAGSRAACSEAARRARPGATGWYISRPSGYNPRFVSQDIATDENDPPLLLLPPQAAATANHERESPMRGWLFTAIVVLSAIRAGEAPAQIDAAKLAEAYKAYDLTRNEGKGFTDSADSGTLGWGEGAVIESYAQMWEATGDPYWLAKIGEHFQRIMAAASDPDGDGFLSWNTKTYSCAVANAERLHNVSEADIEPAYQKNMNGEAAARCTGHTYVLEFHAGPERFRILDWTTRQVLAAEIAYEDGAAIAQIPPFRFKIKGRPRQGDRFMVRTAAPEPIEYAVHQGMFVYPAAVFIEAVKTRTELRERFGADADKFLAFINKHVFEKNEQDWLEMGEAGGGYRFAPTLTDRYPNRIMPHNQFAALARAWLVLKDLEGAHPLMARRAEQMVRYFRSHLELDETNNAYRWHYWDWTEYGRPGSSGYEDTSHASLSMSLAVAAARRGVVFTEEDMVRIANTWLKLMWNRDEEKPAMAASVDGKGPHTFSPLMARWSELSQWDRKVHDLALKTFLSKGPDQQARSAPEMLLCAKRAGIAP
ncbi:MAG: hypothetical protein HUU20_03415 [Pirellulales bacterium]|nr:hypothetical protein [Pirellulales bacterium]